MRVLGACPKCGAVDAIFGMAFGKALHCSSCRAVFLDYSRGELGVALRNKTVIPVDTFYLRRNRKSRQMLTTGLYLPPFLRPHASSKLIIEYVSAAVSQTFGLAIIEDDDSQRIVELQGKWWKAGVQLCWSEAPVIMDVSNGGQGHRSSREIMRYIRKMIQMLCMDDLPTFGRGYILKNQLSAADGAALVKVVQQKMAVTPFRFRDNVRRPMTEPMGSAFPA